MRKNKCRGKAIGLYIAAFGIGLIVAMIFPHSWVIAILAIAVVILGISIGK